MRIATKAVCAILAAMGASDAKAAVRPHLLGGRVRGITMAAVFLGAWSIAAASPAEAVTQRCWRECRWTVVMGKCKTLGGVRVPCPLRKKVCGERLCSQTSH